MTRFNPHALTPRQSQIAPLVGDGLSYQAIAQRLGITPRTVRVHVSAIADKLTHDGSTPYRRVMRWALEHRAA